MSIKPRSFVMLLAVCILGAAGPVRPLAAQSVAQMVGSDLKNTAFDIVGVWVSPFRASPRSWLIAGGLVGAATAMSTWDDNVDRWMVANRQASEWSALKELREGGAFFAGSTIAPIVGGVYILGLATGSRSIRDGVFGCVASYVAGSVVRTQVIYRLVDRERPDSSRTGKIIAPPAIPGDQYNFRPASGVWGMQAFPAGHVANVASCAGFLSYRFHMPWAEPVMYLVVAGVGVGRMVDRRHWTSDTVLGTIFGIALGKEVARRSRARIEKERADAAAPPGADTTHSPPPGDQRGTPESAFSPGNLLKGLYVAPVAGQLTMGWRMSF